MSNVFHPDSSLLFNYFSNLPERALSVEERRIVADHIELCEACAALAEEVHEHDRIWESISPAPENFNEQDSLDRVIVWIRSRLNQSLNETSEKITTIPLGGIKVMSEDKGLTLYAGTSDVITRETARKRNTGAEYRPFARSVRRKLNDVRFVAREDFAAVRLLLNGEVVFEAFNWRCRQDKFIAADLIIKDPQALVWEFKDGLVWQSVSIKGEQS